MNRGQTWKKHSQWHVLWIAPQSQSKPENATKLLFTQETAISLIRYSTYQHIDNSFKTPIQPTTTNLNTADGLLMTALGMTALHLRIADFKFTHNFIICNRLPDTEIIFGIDIQKKSQFHMLGTRIKIVTYKKKVSSLHIQGTVNRRQQ